MKQIGWVPVCPTTESDWRTGPWWNCAGYGRKEVAQHVSEVTGEKWRYHYRRGWRIKECYVKEPT